MAVMTGHRSRPLPVSRSVESRRVLAIANLGDHAEINETSQANGQSATLLVVV
jgi:hypothetical protein